MILGTCASAASDSSSERDHIRVLTTTVGDYPKIPNRPRPARLRAALARFDRKEIGEEDLRRVEDEVTVEVIDEQLEAGLDIITDGQIRWGDPQTYIACRLSGASINGLVRYFDNNTYFGQPIVEGELAWTGPITVSDYRFAAAHSPKPVKAVLTGPYTLARLSDNRFYPSLEDCVIAYAAALHQEAAALEEAGAPLIQLNEPSILDYKDDWPLFATAVSTVFEGIEAETAVYTFFRDAEGLFPQMLDLPCDILGLDFVSGPANFDTLKGVDFRKKLGLGIVDGRNVKLESVDYLLDRLRQVAESVPLERVHLNPSCGLEFLPREAAYAKLQRLAEAARAANEVMR